MVVNPYIFKVLLCLIAFSFLLNCQVFCQTEIGIRGGLNSSQLVYFFDNNTVEDQKGVNRIEAGIFLEQRLKPKFNYILEFNYFETGNVFNATIPVRLQASSLESNSLLKYQLLQRKLKPSFLLGFGFNKYLEASDSRGFDYDFDDENINGYGFGFILGGQLEYKLNAMHLFFDARFKKSVTNFIEADTEDFGITVKKRAVVYSVGLKYSLQKEPRHLPN